jgi:hypothetical protein
MPSSRSSLTLSFVRPLMTLPRGRRARRRASLAASLRRYHPVQVPRVRPPAVSAEPVAGAAPLAAMRGTLIEARDPPLVSPSERRRISDVARSFRVSRGSPRRRERGRPTLQPARRASRRRTSAHVPWPRGGPRMPTPVRFVLVHPRTPENLGAACPGAQELRPGRPGPDAGGRRRGRAPGSRPTRGSRRCTSPSRLHLRRCALAGAGAPVPASHRCPGPRPTSAGSNSCSRMSSAPPASSVRAARAWAPLVAPGGGRV